jgi:hypothetical protein
VGKLVHPDGGVMDALPGERYYRISSDEPVSFILKPEDSVLQGIQT